MSKNQIDNLKEIKGSNNIILNTIGNVCGYISYWFQKIQLKWGTMYEWSLDDLDLEEFIDKPEYTVDEIW